MGILKELDVLKATTYEMANNLKNISDLLTNKNAVIKLEVSANIPIQTGMTLKYHLKCNIFYHSTDCGHVFSFPAINFLFSGAETYRSK